MNRYRKLYDAAEAYLRYPGSGTYRERLRSRLSKGRNSDEG